MLDFYSISKENVRKKCIEIKPVFIVKSHPNDLMIRGRDFYAVWNEETGLWSKDEGDVIRMIDADIDKFASEIPKPNSDMVVPKHMSISSSGLIDVWHKYCQKQMRDCYKELDNKIIFSNTKTLKRDYVSRRLPYPLEEGSYDSWDEILSTLYSPEEREKIEWAIGSIISGDSKEIQKFIVFYGTAGSGKSTIMNIIQMLFDGYYNLFDAKELTSSNNSFALESFKNNPLVSIQHDGDLSRIEDNTKLNSIVSHETMEVNEKFKSKYTARFNSFLFMGTNKPVKITEAKSGLIRRLIDVRPTGNKIPYSKYKQLMAKIPFELGGIAWHCLEVYKKLGIDYYDNYIPKDMISSTNDFYDFIENNYELFAKENGVTLRRAWELYKDYVDYANVQYPFSMRQLRVELENYFDDHKSDYYLDGVHLSNYYFGFKTDRFPDHKKPISEDESKEDGPYGIKQDNDGNWIIFKDYSEFERGSFLNWSCGDCIAQYAKADGTPKDYWTKVKTRLSDLDWRELHYVLLPKNHIVIDFDLRGPDGEKNLQLNLEAAKKFPKTYAETSKSGKGIHLHYIYDGDVSKLSHIYDEGIEIKTFGGKAALRRKLTLCNDLEISHINSGLPLKGVKNTVVDMNVVNLEKSLRTTIKKCLMKEVHGDTTSNVDFIKKILDDAYASGKPYDVSDLMQSVINFANNSSHQSSKCLKTVGQMKFKSAEQMRKVFDDGGFIENNDVKQNDLSDIIFYDIEVFPNLFIVCWKTYHKDHVVKMINPTSLEVEPLLHQKLVGFNNRRYDNHILYARAILGYTNMQLYELSQKIINYNYRTDPQPPTFTAAYNISYTDVWDFATNKQGLKQWEIDLGIYHLENAHPWDKPVDEKYWEEIATYCANDVIATEAVFDHLDADFKTRELLSDLSGLSLNDSNRNHITKILIGNDKEADHVYTDLATGRQYLKGEKYEWKSGKT